jgi:hypothetical protein
MVVEGRAVEDQQIDLGVLQDVAVVVDRSQGVHRRVDRGAELDGVGGVQHFDTIAGQERHPRST